MRYEIFEGNMERLQKKLKRIENKCRKYGCEFRFEIVGETFRTLRDEDSGEKYTARFVVVEAEGKAIVNDWQFVAAVEHTPKGNLFSGVSGIEIPERYYTSNPVCEHCGTSHKRKYTYIVMNTVTGEFKQVGKSCLGDFTHGLDASAAALYISYFDTLIAGETPYEGGAHTRYIEVETALKYVAETIRAFGYVRAQDAGISTMLRAFRYYALEQGWRGFSGKEEKQYRAEMESVSFNPDSPEIARQVADALKWVEGQEDKNNYLHNLKTVCALPYVNGKHFGLLASLFPAYNRDLKYQAEKAERERKAAKELEGKMGSRHIGNIKDRITVQVDSFRCVTSWESDFGITRLYEIMDNAGNVFTWKTGKILEEGVSSIIGTVKAHTEFRGVHQTELTRCRVAA